MKSATTTVPRRILLVAFLTALAISASAQPVQMTHSLEPNTIVWRNAIACTTTSGPLRTRENSYYRSFDLAFFGTTNPVRVTSVDFGIEEAAHPAGVQPLHVNLYVDTNGGAPRLGDLQQLDGTIIQQANTTLRIVNVPLTGLVPAGGTLVVEVMSEDHIAQSTRAVFFIGSNPYGQTAPSYIRAPICDASEITTYAAIGFPQVHIVMTVYGEQVAGRPGDLNCDGAVNFGDINPFVLALTNPAGYAAAYPNCDIMNADINQDGKVDFGDINPFVRLLTNP